MSSNSNQGIYLDATPRFSPPQSAQPQRSLFGGPSSRDVDLEQYAEAKQEGDDEEQDGLEVFMREQPLIDNDMSDDATYEESDDATGCDDAVRHRVPDYMKPRRESTETPRIITRDQASPPSSSSSSSSLSYRPNRFRGSVATWRHLTAGERLIAEAMETDRSRDLAAHLYNAFALRARARAVAEPPRQDEAESFLPPKFWTAWPMPANKVPRVDEHLRNQEEDGWTLRMQPDLRPSAELEESIIAIVLKTAKERFEARAWMSGDTTGHGGKEESTLFGHGNEVEGDGVIKNDPESLHEAEFRPVIQADDDKSRRQLRPLTRNILAQLDDLLLGLHHARKGTKVMGDSSTSEWLSDTESSASGVSFRGKSPSKPRGRKARERRQSRGRKRTRRSFSRTSSNRSRSESASTSMESPPSAESVESRAPDSPRSRERSTDSKRSATPIRLGLRDWSDVVGVASMIGWPPTVVSRAAKRCAGLFGEDMAFQTLKEGRVEQVQKGKEQKWEYVESESEMEDDDEATPPPPAGRSTRSRSRAPSTQRERTPGEASQPPETESAGPRPKGKGEHRKLDLICPIRTCSRHKNGFTRRWNLNQHMKRMHPNYRPTKPGVIPRISVPTMSE